MHSLLVAVVVAAAMAAAAVVVVRINLFLVMRWLRAMQFPWQLVPVVQQEYGAEFSLALQAVHLRYSEAQQQLHQLTAAVAVEVGLALPSVQAARQQMDSLVAPVVFHPPLAERSAVPERAVLQVISWAAWRITAVAEQAVLMAVQRHLLSHPATMQAPQVD
jgi:hypothetical protein